MFSTFEKIKELCRKKGISLNQLEEKLGFSQNYIYSMKKGNPKVENLQKIADYFHVSTDYLLGRTDNPRIASDEKSDKLDTAETQLVAAFRNQTHNMTEEDKIRFNKAIESMMVTAKTIMDDESKWR
ncbi:TPA: helix-turn-helix transcriptional regulator [Streptococcus suis]|nr:helix-turn-helix transcriptional regulator [Streptococcus suis]HEM2714213.1 helix-turn-helix transcriptional regulator [Streptococcus suis]HEP1783694.1 helix-turn-helix transcriptional regulator [Streptococcus suis]